MLSVKLTFQQLEAFRDITANDASVLTASKDNLWRLAGMELQGLYSRLNKKLEFGFRGVKSVRLNVKECLALRQFILFFSPQTGGEYYTVLRTEIFTEIDKKL